MPRLLTQLAQSDASAATQASPERDETEKHKAESYQAERYQTERHKEITSLPQVGVADMNVGGNDAMISDSTATDPLATDPSVFICPECGGALTPVQHGQFLQYRCHTGHIFGDQSLAGAYAERVEYALWAALSALKERAELNRRLAVRTNSARLRIEYEHQAAEARRQAEIVEELLARLGRPL
jgi:hypothetical protein